MTGDYRGPAHLICNLLYNEHKDIAICIHNLKNFDSNLILKYIETDFVKNVYVLPKSTDKFMSFSLNLGRNNRLKFLDTYQFLPSSLENLTENLKTSGLHNFKITKNILQQKFGYISDDILEKIICKSAFPYEFLDKFEKFDFEYFPNIEEFNSSLNFTKIDENRYNRAKYIYKYFKLRNFGDFTDFYCLLDSCLLADIFTKFRNDSLRIYGLEPLHYFSIPSLSWDAMLKYTKIEIELFSDVNMYLWIEKSLRGGVSQVSCRKAKANNIYMENYNEYEDSSFISYFDAK